MSYQNVYNDPLVLTARTVDINDYPVLYSGYDIKKIIVNIHIRGV